MPAERGLWVVTFDGPKGQESFLVQAAWRGEAIRNACRITGYDDEQVVGAVGPDIPAHGGSVAVDAD